MNIFVNFQENNSFFYIIIIPIHCGIFQFNFAKLKPRLLIITVNKQNFSTNK